MPNLNVSPISISTFKRTLAYHLETGCAPLILGAPGVGKSQVIKEFCEENGYQLITRMLSQMQPSDFIIPYVDREQNITHWAIADWLKEFDELAEKVIIFLDELPAAPHDVQVAAYQLLLDREVAGNKLPDNVHVIAAGNRVSDGAISSDMGTAAADRLSIFNIKVNPDEWLEWAEAAGVHPYIMAYIKVEPGQLNDEDNFEDIVRVSPRSWATLSKYLYVHEKQANPDPELLKPILESRIGKVGAANFFAKINELKNLYPVEEYLKAVRDKEDKNRLIEMAPTTQTTNYGLMFSLSNRCETIKDIVDSMLIFKRFWKEVSDSMNRKEVYTSAVTILAGRLMKMDDMHDIMKNKTFAREIAPDIINIPTLGTLKKKAEELAKA